MLDRERGVYTVNASTYDIRYFYNTELKVTIFVLKCKTPFVWIPQAFSSLEKPELIPIKYKSQAIEIQAVAELECNETTPTL